MRWACECAWACDRLAPACEGLQRKLIGLPKRGGSVAACGGTSRVFISPGSRPCTHHPERVNKAWISSRDTHRGSVSGRTSPFSSLFRTGQCEYCMRMKGYGCGRLHPLCRTSGTHHCSPVSCHYPFAPHVFFPRYRHPIHTSFLLVVRAPSLHQSPVHHLASIIMRSRTLPTRARLIR